MSVCYKVKEAKNKQTEETSRCCQMLKRYNLVKVGRCCVHLSCVGRQLRYMYYSFIWIRENLGDWARRKKKSSPEKIAEEIQECYCCMHWFTKIFVLHTKGSISLQKGTVAKEMNSDFKWAWLIRCPKQLADLNLLLSNRITLRNVSIFCPLKRHKPKRPFCFVWHVYCFRTSSVPQSGNGC
jgi:hypothetical protein